MHLHVHVYQFSANRVCRSVKTVHTNLVPKNCKLHKFATTNSNFEKLTLSDMHYRKAYININFQQNRVSRSVKTVSQIYLQKLEIA